MGCVILFDPQQERAVFFDTTRERAIDHDAFIGDDADAQAEDFLEWEDFDPRTYPREGYSLDQMIDLWRLEAFDDMENFVGARFPRRADRV